MTREFIFGKLREAGFEASEKQTEMFYIYHETLVSWSGKMNLTAVKNGEEIVTRHFTESLLPLKAGILFPGAVCADVGTGAGFPGIPLAIMEPRIKMSLIESLNKRVDFLDEVIERLGLENCRTFRARAEDVARGEMRESFDVVFSRAVARTSTLAELCLPLVKPGGLMAAFKSVLAKEELAEAENSVEILGGGGAEIFGSEERNIVLIKKIAPTPPKYPRRAGKAASNPIK